MMIDVTWLSETASFVSLELVCARVGLTLRRIAKGNPVRIHYSYVTPSSRC